jgi:hypothetical protein
MARSVTGGWAFRHAENDQGSTQDYENCCGQQEKWRKSNPYTKEHGANDGAGRCNAAADEHKPD